MSTHNPKAPKVRRTMTDVQSPRDQFLDRLRQLGAAADVVDAVRDNWDDPEWDNRDHVVALSDEALRLELAAIEREHYEGTHTEDEEADELRQALEAKAAEILPEPVQVVTLWVDEDPEPPARAVAVEALEARARRPRKGVLAHVAAVIAEHDA